MHTLAFPIVGAWFFALTATGEIVTFDFTGSVHSVYNPYGVVSPSLVQIGDPVQVSLRFDTTTPDGYSDDPTRGEFVSPGWLKVNFNGLAFESANYALIDIIHTDANGGQDFFKHFDSGTRRLGRKRGLTTPTRHLVLPVGKQGRPMTFYLTPSFRWHSISHEPTSGTAALQQALMN